MAASRLRIATAGCALAGLVWLAPAAGATGPDDLVVDTTPLDADEASDQSDSVDELVSNQPTDTADDLVEGTTSVDALERPGTTGLDQVDTGRTQTESQVQAEGQWEPTPCDLLVVPTPQLPLSSDLAGWGRMLHDAEERIGETRTKLDQAEGIYSRMRHSRREGVAGGPVAQQLDTARKDYEQALCALPKLQEAARRTGLPAGLIHRSPPASQP